MSAWGFSLPPTARPEGLRAPPAEVARMANPRRRTARMGARSNRSAPSSKPVGAAASRHPTLRQRARYAFDNTMARGTPALVGWLAAVTAVLVLVFTAVVLIAGL